MLAGLALAAAVSLLAVALPVSGPFVADPEPPPGSDERATVLPVHGVWISAAEIARLPTTGPAWEALAETATAEWDEPALDDQNSRHDVQTLAGAFYAVRLSDPAVRSRVVESLESVEGSVSDEILPLARNLLSYVIAADVIGFRSESFEEWLATSLTRRGQSRAGIETLLDSALSDPSNHGAHARASVLAVARYLGDDDTVAAIAARFHDWVGRDSEGFEWRELDWQADPERPRGVNAVDAQIEGVDVDGVLPEEQRRSGSFAIPVPQEPYVWEGLQGAIATAELLHRAGYEAFEWEDQALRRAVEWLYTENDYPAEGDDRWIPWLVNKRYASDFPTESPTTPGKNVGFADWTHGSPGP